MIGDQVVLEATNLTRHIAVRVPGRIQSARLHAVDGVDLQVRRGETLGLVGESGSGKSTLARLLTGLERPTSGEVKVLGERTDNLRGRRMREARRHIQMIFQDPATALDPRMTVQALIGEPLIIHPDVVPRKARREWVMELLELVGLNPDHASRYPHQFSGGQRQRIGIARALALRPDVLVCDEPVSALDVSVQAQIINLLSNLQRELGIACLFIAHDLAVVEHIADRTAVMYLGRIIETGRSEDLYDAPRHPYTQALLSAIPVPDPQAKVRSRVRLEGEVPSPIDIGPGCRFRTRCPLADSKCASIDPILGHSRGGSVGSDHLVECHFPILSTQASGSAQ